MKHEDVYSDTWKNKKDGWLDYVKNDVLSRDFSYAMYSKCLQKKPDLERKNV